MEQGKGEGRSNGKGTGPGPEQIPSAQGNQTQESAQGEPGLQLSPCFFGPGDLSLQPFFRGPDIRTLAHQVGRNGMVQFRIDFRQIFRIQKIIQLTRFRSRQDGQPGEGFLDGLPGPGDFRPGVLFLGPHGFQGIGTDQSRLVVGLDQIRLFPFQGGMPFQKIQILLKGPERYIVEGRLRTEGHPGAVKGRMLGCQIVGGTLLPGFQPAKEIRFPGGIDAQPGHGRIPVGGIDDPGIGTHTADFVIDPPGGFITAIGPSQVQPGQGFPFADAQLGPGFFHPGLGRLKIPVVLQGQINQGIQFGILEGLPPVCQLLFRQRGLRCGPVISRRMFLGQLRPGRHFFCFGLGVLLPGLGRLHQPGCQGQGKPHNHRFPPFHGHRSYLYQQDNYSPD